MSLYFIFPDVELVYRDPTGGLSILNLDHLNIRVLMTNSTFVSAQILIKCTLFIKNTS